MQRAGSRLAAQIFGGSPEAHLALLRASWNLAVGPEVARRTLVVTLANRTLVVRVASGEWRKVLMKMRGEVVSRLRETMGSLAPSRLSFLEGGLAEPPAAKLPASAKDPNANASEALQEAARVISDPTLRSDFLQSAARYLAGKVAD
jgi:hypothetical protein